MFSPRRILVGLDFGLASVAAVEHAADVARTYGAGLTIAHVCDPVSAISPDAIVLTGGEAVVDLERASQRELDAVVATVRERVSEVSGLLCSGKPAETLLALAKEMGADLVVLGTHGRQGLARAALGSVAELVVRRSTVPVLTVHALSA